MSAPHVVVVGSCNEDIVVAGGPIPAPGQTVSAESVHLGVGGKGLNQAIAAARAGANVSLIGAVGDDQAGTAVREALEDAGVDASRLRVVGASTGCAIVTVSADGENAISVVAGANDSFGDLTESDRRAIADADVLMLQLEMPMALAVVAAGAAADAGTPVLLTPAPVAPIPQGLWTGVSLLIANQHEAVALTGVNTPEDAMHALLERVPAAIVTLGAGGCAWANREERGRSPALPVRPIDTTAAGDTFAGYVAAGLAENRDLKGIIRVATRAAALCVTRHGASASIPTRAEVDAFLSAGVNIDDPVTEGFPPR